MSEFAFTGPKPVIVLLFSLPLPLPYLYGRQQVLKTACTMKLCQVEVINTPLSNNESLIPDKGTDDWGQKIIGRFKLLRTC